jgi:hypothetical protein
MKRDLGQWRKDVKRVGQDDGGPDGLSHTPYLQPVTLLKSNFGTISDKWKFYEN